MPKKNFNYLKNDLAIPCPAGDHVKDKHILKRKGNNMFLEKVGEIDIQEQINSYEDGVSLAKMIAKYKRGDASALNRVEGFYGDVSEMPTEFIDAVENMYDVADIIKKATEATETTTEATETTTEATETTTEVTETTTEPTKGE